jgi:hypothetical protein
MNLRKWLANLARVTWLAVVFVVVLGGSTLLIALIVSWFRGLPVTDPANLYAGLVCGLIAWLFIAVFHLRRETMRLPFLDREPFMKQLEAGLAELGYERQGDSAVAWYKPSFRSYLLGGRVQLDVDDNQAVVSGPKFCLELLRRWLRIQSQLNNVQQSIRESRRRQGERLLSRVQVAIRVPPERWSDIQQHVLKPLDREGEVICELNILAQNEGGIRDNVVEFQVRSWLAGQGIVALVHKDFLQREDGPTFRSEPQPSAVEAV